MTADNFASYTNYRYWPEMLSAGLLDIETANTIISYRLARGGELLGMTRFKFGGETSRPLLDDWPYAGYAYNLLSMDRIGHYLLGYYAHMAHHMTPGTFTAYESVAIAGTENRSYSGDYCVPSQLVPPLMTKWMLVFEERDTDLLWLNRAAPRAWHEDGKTIEVQNAPTRWGKVSYRIISQIDSDCIKVVLQLPDDPLLAAIHLRVRAPHGRAMKSAEVDGKAWSNFDPKSELIRLPARMKGQLEVVARFSVIGE